MTDTQDNSGDKNTANSPLFRKEALQHKKPMYLGKTLVVAPISFATWAFGIFAIALMLALFIYFGEYAKREEVRGFLVPDKGVIHIYSNTNGTILERFVEPGQKVAQGQPLYLISTEQHTMSDLGAASQQISSLQKQITTQKDLVALSEKNLARYKSILEQKFLSEAEYQKHYSEHLRIKLELNRLEQELIHLEERSSHAIKSPVNGVISTLIATTGDHVAEQKLLAAIIPDNALLQGVLFVPTEAIGFVKPGQKILLKYDAFPYQNFGLYEAVVGTIDKSILFPKDIDIPGDSKAACTNTPVYRVTVNLKQQTVNVYAKPEALTAGMTFKASLIGENQRIWQWLIDPIYSMRGNLATP